MSCSTRTHHHLLDHASRLSVQVTEFRVLGRDLRSVDLGVTFDHALPPLAAFDFFQMNVDFLLII